MGIARRKPEPKKLVHSWGIVKHSYLPTQAWVSPSWGRGDESLRSTQSGEMGVLGWLTFGLRCLL